MDIGEEVFDVIMKKNRMFRAFKLCISYQNLCFSQVACEFVFIYYVLSLLFENINQVNKIFLT